VVFTGDDIGRRRAILCVVGVIVGLSQIEGPFQFPGRRFLEVKLTKIWNCFQKEKAIFATFEPNHSSIFDSFKGS